MTTTNIDEYSRNLRKVIKFMKYSRNLRKVIESSRISVYYRVSPCITVYWPYLPYIGLIYRLFGLIYRILALLPVIWPYYRVLALLPLYPVPVHHPSTPYPVPLPHYPGTHHPSQCSRYLGTPCTPPVTAATVCSPGFFWFEPFRRFSSFNTRVLRISCSLKTELTKPVSETLCFA